MISSGPQDGTFSFLFEKKHSDEAENGFVVREMLTTVRHDGAKRRL